MQIFLAVQNLNPYNLKINKNAVAGWRPTNSENTLKNQNYNKMAVRDKQEANLIFLVNDQN